MLDRPEETFAIAETSTTVTTATTAVEIAGTAFGRLETEMTDRVNDASIAAASVIGKTRQSMQALPVHGQVKLTKLSIFLFYQGS
jgi:hypothetical protein